ncbi:MAG: 1,4-alpha-glucan branching protein GlgB, partial [Gemmatimonadetes bacterium]|nr:1,4-alpha-glucan branching protein GlgB [Gemmatimonadota bacterium]
MDQELADALPQACCPRPFDILGQHPAQDEAGWLVRAWLPWAGDPRVVREGRADVPMEAVAPGLFEARVADADGAFVYRLRAEDPTGRTVTWDDPYRFTPVLDEARIRAFLEGGEPRVQEVLGAHPCELEGVQGTRFAVWAPHARGVSVVGSHNGWDATLHPMRPRGATGVWELFLPAVRPGTLYKYHIATAPSGAHVKADPVGFQMELRPATASVVAAPSRFRWTDDGWMEGRATAREGSEPMSVYEVHLGSWKRTGSKGWLGYRELANSLLPYVKKLGFTHVELLPVMEHPLDESWGYQTVGYFAPTTRYGEPDDLRAFVDQAHALGLGVILDWVPAHFPTDAHGLGRFDGTSLYEHPDPRKGYHPDWGTYVFDVSRPEVRAFLVSSALHWLESYHADGLRVDAVASMLYLDYSRPEGEWLPNAEGGNENWDAVGFFRELNERLHEAVPGAVVIAEESTAWPRVTHAVADGGLGFDQKWNMGWMHDTLDYMSTDPLFRKGLHERLTFGLMYAFSERFVLPFSHDEVVHGKYSLLGRMPGEYEARFEQLRVLLGYQWTQPGKKLLFMGAEIGQWNEWNVGDSLDWQLLDFPAHRGVRDWVTALNALYVEEPALHRRDFHPDGFEWLDPDDAERSMLSWVRRDPDSGSSVVVVANFTPVDRPGFAVAAPLGGRYCCILDSDAGEYGGLGRFAPVDVDTEDEPLHGREH